MRGVRPVPRWLLPYYNKTGKIMKIARSTIGLAAEFAVASELGRRNIYAQPTFGHQKRTDLLIFGKDNELLKVEVKGKQGREWPNCKGIYGRNVILVFVDFAGKSEFERPDFYILDAKYRTKIDL